MISARGVLCFSALLLLGTPPAHALEANLGVEGFLLEGKTAGGINLLLLFNEHVGLDMEAALLMTDEGTPREGLASDEVFLGFLLGLHVQLQRPINPLLRLGVGTGVDFWPLPGVAWGEFKVGMPLYAEARLHLFGGLGAFLRSRYYLLHSQGLAPGEDYSGQVAFPVLNSVGLVGVF
ncbi:hypothetical protein KKF91_21245 [Myxococcota bacterium]|nr:hypothetical protein [Myxococcota bacterium]MBU1433071.1 hypothetical protein [Myxococcota bacterium]MBU1896504.1 hypothetical protein [Myxococcota bacterium]